MKKIFFILIFIFIFSIINLVPISATQLDNLFLDDVTKQYISEKIPNNAKFVDTKYSFEFVQVTRKGIGNPINKVNTNVYNFQYIENSQNKNYTFITLELPKDLKTYKDDTIKIFTNLSYVSPIECLVLGKNKEEEQWQKINNFELATLFNSIENYSEQIDSKTKYTKFIISFPSVQFENVENISPQYNIIYMNYPIYNYVKFLNIILISLLICIIVYILLKCSKK